MATLDTINVSSLEYEHMLTDSAVRDIARLVFWQVYAAHQDDSYKGRIGPVPFSIKLSKLRPLFEHWFGPPPLVLGP